MSTRHLFAALLVVGCASVACIASSPSEEEDLGEASAAVTNVPGDVGCIVITATGNRVAERRFDVVAGASSILKMNGLPVGSVVFRGDAYAGACSALTSTSSPTWVSDPVSASLVASVDVPVKLSLRRNGSSTVSVDFEDGPDAGDPDADGGTDGATDAPPPAMLTITPGFRDFGSQSIMSPGPAFVFSVMNVGGTVTGVPSVPLLGGPNASDFEVVGNTCTAPILPGATCTMTVRFAPKSSGTKNATLSQNPAGGGGVTATLVGSGSFF